MDVLRDVEDKDVTNVLEMHIFITQFFHKFDLRTTMLYICENHFQRLCRRSMFTGLKAINHFGRPDMPSFLKVGEVNYDVFNQAQEVKLMFQTRAFLAIKSCTMSIIFLFQFVQKKHSYVSKVGVFSCGPGMMTKSVTDGVEAVNRSERRHQLLKTNH